MNGSTVSGGAPAEGEAAGTPSASLYDQPPCAAQPTLFFPEDYGVQSLSHRYRRQVNAAKEVCADCALRLPCLAAGMNEDFGVWGGLTARERHELRRGPSGSAPTCGQGNDSTLPPVKRRRGVA